MGRFLASVITLVLSLFGLVQPLQQSRADDHVVATGATVASGQSHVCATNEYGHVRCWGMNNSGQASPPQDLGVVTQIAAGTMHTCVVDLDEKAICWGLNQFGMATVPSDLSNVIQISGGDRNTCAVHHQGNITCWGDNSYGQLQIPNSLGRIAEIKLGNGNVCALDNTGKVTCWGRNDWGQSDVPNDLGRVVQITLGGVHSCALSDSGKVSCWGYQAYGANVPNALRPIKKISAGYSHTCALDEQGKVICWGHSPYGSTDVPADLGSASEVIAAGYHSCIVGDLGQIRCWGWNQDGQTSVPQDLGRVLTSRTRGIIAAKPKIIGLPLVGSQVTATTNGWEFGVSFSYQWVRDGVPIPASTLGTYSIQASDYLKKIGVVVTGSKAGYLSETTYSDVVIPVKKNEGISVLRFTGDAQVGSSVSVSPSPRNSKFDYSFQWFRDESTISGANSRTLRLSAPDIGSSISVQVCSLYFREVANCRTEEFNSAVKLGALKNIKVSIYGIAKIGRLLYAACPINDTQASLTYQWLRNGQPITGATGSNYFVEELDFGKVISLRASVTKPGYETVTQTSTSKLVK